MKSYLLKSNFKRNLQKHNFVYIYIYIFFYQNKKKNKKNKIVYVCEVISKCYPKFITCLYFFLALVRWNSSPCHLMELFKDKVSFKKKEWHLYLRLSIGSVRKMLPKRFLSKGCLSGKELKQQVRLIKYVENKISNSTSHKKIEEKREEQKHNPTSKTSFLKLLKNCH